MLKKIVYLNHDKSQGLQSSLVFMPLATIYCPGSYSTDS